MSKSIQQADPIETATESSRGGEVAHAWRALRHRNFRLFFLGQSISVVGTWMTRLATNWLVYRLTDSALLLGMVNFAGQAFACALAPVAGVWVERLERRKLLIVTQVAGAAQSLTLAGLTLAHVITLPEVIALAVMQGIINAFDTPGRHAFLVLMVEDRRDLGNAIAINSSMVNGARLLGPAIAGLVIGLVGEGWCFLLDGISYVPVVLSLYMMRITQRPGISRSVSMLSQLREGFDYVRRYRPIRSVLVFFSLTTLLGYTYSVLLPVFAGKVLDGGAPTLGWLTGATGVGALISAVSLALRKTSAGLSHMLQIASGILGVALILFGLSKTLALSLLLLMFVGFGLIQSASASNTIIQSLVPEDKRARVMSWYTMAFYGAAPFGSLVAGALAEHIGAPATAMLSGASCLLVSSWMSFELPRIKAAMLGADA